MEFSSMKDKTISENVDLIAVDVEALDRRTEEYATLTFYVFDDGDYKAKIREVCRKLGYDVCTFDKPITRCVNAEELFDMK